MLLLKVEKIKAKNVLIKRNLKDYVDVINHNLYLKVNKYILYRWTNGIALLKM